MPLPFALVCDLLESTYKLSESRKNHGHVVKSWFTRHRHRINAHDTDLAALLSTLLPEKRTDRVYCIQASRLEQVVGRAFFLGSSRIAELCLYRQAGQGTDLADCVSRILTATPSPGYCQNDLVTVEEIDQLLCSLAAGTKWSSPSIRASRASLNPTDRADLETTYRRLSATEAKWFTRLILKSYQPLILDPHLIYRLCDPVLPCILKIHDDFSTAINAAQDIRAKLLPNSVRKTPREDILGLIKPRLGIKVGRQPWIKGRSIKHCLDMGHGRMSVEDKIDGEYCQIHIDLSKPNQRIQIFSKSGKDSTEDRRALHGTILESLRIGCHDAGIKRACILEGELVAYDDQKHKILPFHKIRQHVRRRGLSIGTEQDSPPGPYEHLMIIYYDIMLLDDQSLINLKHSERFRFLCNIVSCRKGWAELVPRQVIDFGQNLGASSLRKAFASTILAKKEGLVLKPDEPYFDFSEQRRKFSSCCIKLKKEYIGHFGDVGDFAVVGARYDPAKAKSYRIPGLKWTHFYVGCLDNKVEFQRWNEKPRFTIVNVLELNETMLRDVVTYANPRPVPPEGNDFLHYKLAPGVELGLTMSVVFTNPLVFDLKCFSFDKVGNTGFWSLRFPSVTKVHFDREFTDTVSFEQLQAMARDATTAQELEDSQENLQWIAKLEAADPRGIAVDAISQLTVTTMPTPSPRKSTQSSNISWSPTSPLAAKCPRTPTSPCKQAPIQRPLLMGPPARDSTLSVSIARDSSRAKVLPGSKRLLPLTGWLLSDKRPKIEQTCLQTTTIASENRSLSQTRKSLANISGNSQSALHSYLPTPHLHSKIIDLTSSSEVFLTTTGAKKQRSQPAGPSSPVTEGNVTMMAVQKNAEASVRPASPAKQLGQNGGLSRTGCRYKGIGCQLARKIILISPGLLETSTETKALFQDHGIDDLITDLDKWIEEDNSRATYDNKFSPEPLLLVDSQQRDETRALLKRIDEQRRVVPEERRGWIGVYDWRLLKNLSIMEDEGMILKYYDGFQDPWRRWYLAIV